MPFKNLSKNIHPSASQVIVPLDYDFIPPSHKSHFHYHVCHSMMKLFCSISRLTGYFSVVGHRVSLSFSIVRL